MKMEYIRLWTICIVVVNSALCAPVRSSKVLVFGEAGGGSHYFVVEAIGRSLARRGHNVTVFVSDMYTAERDTTLLNYLIYKSKVTMDEWDNLLTNITSSYLTGESFLSQLQSQVSAAPHVFKLMRDQCDSALVNEHHLDKLRRENYDILVGDMYMMCASLLGQALDIPYVLISPPLPVSWHYTAHSTPINPSYIPCVNTGYDSKMTFMTRVLNSVQIGMDAVTSRALLGDYDHLKQVYNIRPDISTYQSLGQARIWFINSHISLDFPRPLFPNTKLVGGITTGPAKSLVGDLASFVNGADNGVIIFSFGSYVSLVNQEMADMFGSAFSQLDQRVIWKARGKTPRVNANNIKRMQWIPMNDLLGHPKTVLLVYHCGVNGVFEAIHHGVPIICLPVFLDQLDIAQRIASKGGGLRLGINSLDVQTLVDAMRRVITDESFRQNMSRMSKILQDEPEHPADRAAGWVEYVIRHDGAHHLRSIAHELNFIQYHLIDVMSFLVVCMAVFAVILVLCCSCLTQIAKRMCFANKVKYE